MRLVFKKQKYIFLLESLLLKHFTNPRVFRHLSGDTGGGKFLLIAGGDTEFQTTDICVRPGPLSYHLERFWALCLLGL